MSSTKSFILAALAVGLAVLGGERALARTQEADPAAKRPNVVLILADDQGYGDLGCQPHVLPAVSTPHIDRLAAEGVRMVEAYANGHVCSPTRAALLTGRYGQRFGYYGNGDAAPGMPATERLLSGYFQAAGYATACFGKWHLGWTPDKHPRRFGFAEFFGFLGGQHDYFDPRLGHAGVGDSEGDAPILDNTRPVPAIKYLTEEFTDRAIDFIERNSARPLCVYLAYNAIHGPLQAPDAYLARHNGGQSGRDKVRAMLACLDDNVGRLLETLDRLDLAENTLVVYLSDNGGPENNYDNWKLRGWKGHFFEGGIRVPAIARWPAGLPAGKVYERPVMAMDVLPTLLAAASIPPHPQHPLDGVNLLPFWRGQSGGRPHEVLHWAMEKGATFAVRRGDWKYVKDRDGEGLFHLAEDVGETLDLREREPNIAAELLALHQAWLDTLPPRLGRADGGPGSTRKPAAAVPQ